jgi:hypothetical protein
VTCNGGGPMVGSKAPPCDPLAAAAKITNPQ